MDLNDFRRKRSRYRRGARDLERTGRDDHLLGPDSALTEVEQEPIFLDGQRAHVAVGLDGQVELGRVAFEVGDHLVAGRVAVRVAGESETGQPVVAPRREQHQRVPPLPPRGCDRVAGFQDDESAALLGQPVAGGKAGLTAAHHRHIEQVWRGVTLMLGAGLGDVLSRHRQSRPPQ
jgi:hypothetical protein